jgi:RNA polymerase sigma factor (TIGR02999 family)
VKSVSSEDITEILSAISAGDREAADRLFPIVYDQLRRMARRRMALESPGQTLQTSDLIHETYLRLLGNRRPHWKDRAHFFAAAAVVMRRILVDRARRRKAVRHGGRFTRVSLDAVGNEIPVRGVDLIALDEALTRLEAHDANLSSVVMLRFFAGLDIVQTSRALRISPATVKRRWEFAKAWLRREMASGDTVS